MSNRDVLLHRKADTHKGDYGHILILAGSVGLSGAGALCANAALRSGSGLVTLTVPESIYSIVAKKAYPEIMVRPLPETKEGTLSQKACPRITTLAEKADVLAIGPGLSQNLQTQKLIRRIIRATAKPLLLDADALNALVGHLELLRPATCDAASGGTPSFSGGRRPETVLTPHPGEFSRLINRPTAYIQKNRQTLAKSFASMYNITLVLKGHRTIVASSGGRLYVNKTGNPGMATAGSGDVLAGIIAALLGQGLGGFEAARLGVYLHGASGDLAAKEKTQAGLIASDIIEKIPAAIKTCNTTHFFVPA